MAVSVQQVLEALETSPDPAGAADAGRRLAGVAALEEAGPADLGFCVAGRDDGGSRLRESAAGMLIVDAEALAGLSAGSCKAVIARSDNARLDFIRMMRRFFTEPAAAPVVHPSAVIDPGAQIGEDVSIGALCTIAADVQIGTGSVLHAGVHLYPRVRIGARVTIGAGTVVGADGYGFERNAAGQLERFPHRGGVVIEDDVEIGANVAIDRGALGNTWIGARARIDNLVHVAHNVRIGEDAAVIAHAMLAGSSRVGARSWVAPCAALLEGVSLGDDAVVGMGSVVTRPVPRATTVVGSPARELREHRALQRVLRELTREQAGDGAVAGPELGRT